MRGSLTKMEEGLSDEGKECIEEIIAEEAWFPDRMSVFQMLVEAYEVTWEDGAILTGWRWLYYLTFLYEEREMKSRRS